MAKVMLKTASNIILRNEREQTRLFGTSESSLSNITISDWSELNAIADEKEGKKNYDRNIEIGFWKGRKDCEKRRK